MTAKFQDVPDSWKYPFGPYRQAPTEYGAEWWLVNPFVSATPWLSQSEPSSTPPLPDGFVEIFGSRPQGHQFRDTSNPSLHLRVALVNWEQDLRHFKRAGVPEWAQPQALEDATRVFANWGMGAPAFYEGRYGWSARFTASELPDFEVDARSSLEATHLIIAQYQLALLERDRMPEMKHPFVPPHVWPNETQGETDATT